MDEDNSDQQSQAVAGPSSSRTSPRNVEQAPSVSTQDDPQPQRRTERSPTPHSHPSSSPTQSRDPSRSPSSSRRSIKRTSTTISPVPEEQPHPASASTSSHKTDPQPPPTKRSRPADPDKRRGQRLFSVLSSTLTQFKRESESDRAATLANKRAAIEARLASKLKDSEKVIDALQRRRGLVWEARGLAEEIATGDAQRKTLRGMKRRMASFLFTPFPPQARSRRSRSERLAHDIPTSLTPTPRAEDRDGEYAVYFLPGKALLEQEDALNQQEDDVDEEIDSFDDRWEETRLQLVERLEGVKRRIREG